MSDADVATLKARASETVEAIAAAYLSHCNTDGSFQTPVTDFVPLLRDGNDYDKQACVDKISTLAALNTSAQYDFVLGNVVEPLVELLNHARTDGIKKGAILSLRKIGEDNDSAATRVSSAGGCKALVDVVRDGADELKFDAIDAIWVLSRKVKSVQMTVVHGGGILVLVDVLSTGSSLMKDRALRILETIVRCTDEYQVQVLAADVMGPTVELLRTGRGEEGSRDTAARLLLALLSTEAGKDAAYAAGVVEPLMAMLANGSYDERNTAAVVLGDLVAPSRPITADTAATQSLVHMIIDGDRRAISAGVVQQLLYHCPANRHVFVENGAVESLLNLMHTGDEFEKQRATSALANLLGNHASNQEIVPASETVEVLIELLRSGTEEQRQLAVNVIGDLASNDSTFRLTVVDAGAVPLLVDLVKNGPSSSQVDAARALDKLAGEDQAIRKIMADAGAVKLLQNQEVVSDTEIAALIAHASETVDAIEAAYFRHREADGGYDSPLMDFIPLLRDGNNYEKQECVERIPSLAAFDIMAQYHFALGNVVEPLVELLNTAETDAIQKGTIQSLHKIGDNNDSVSSRVSAAGGCKALVAIVRDGTDELKLDALNAILVLANKLKSVQMTVVHGDGIPVMVQLLSTGSTLMKDRALRILELIVRCTDDYQTQVVEAGVFAPLVELMKTGCGEERSRDTAAQLVLALLSTDAGKDAAYAAGVVEPLVAMLGDGSYDERNCAALVIGHLVAPSRPVIVNALAAQSLIHSMIDGDRRAINTGVVQQLLYHCPGNRDVFVENGAIEPLLYLMRTGDELEKQRATATLANLMWKHPTNQEIVLASGAVEVLMDLLRSGAEEQRRLAANALGDFVSKKATIQLAVVHAGAIPLLMELMKTGSSTAQVDAARTLGKLAAGDESTQTTMAEAGVVEALCDLLWESRTLTTELRVAATRALNKLAANHKANQARIVDARVVATLVAQWRTGDAKEKRLAATVLRQVTWHPTAFTMIQGLEAMEAIEGYLSELEGETKSNE